MLPQSFVEHYARTMFQGAENYAHVESVVGKPEALPVHERAAEAYTEAMKVHGNYIVHASI